MCRSRLDGFWLRFWWVLLLVVAGCLSALSAHSEALLQPTLPDPETRKLLEQPLPLLLPTLLDDSVLLLSRLQERRLQVGSLQEGLLTASGTLDFSDQLSLKLWQSLNGVGPVLQTLQADLMGISSSLSGLQTGFGQLSTSLDSYTELMRSQVKQVASERDAARLQASVWRTGALVGGGIALASIATLIVLLVVR